jgi:hypothetical protein
MINIKGGLKMSTRAEIRDFLQQIQNGNVVTECQVDQIIQMSSDYIADRMMEMINNVREEEIRKND